MGLHAPWKGWAHRSVPLVSFMRYTTTANDDETEESRSGDSRTVTADRTPAAATGWGSSRHCRKQAGTEGRG